MCFMKMTNFQSHFLDVLKLLQRKIKKKGTEDTWFPTNSGLKPYTCLRDEFKDIFSSNNGTIVIHKKFQEKGLKEKKLSRKGLHSED